MAEKGLLLVEDDSGDEALILHALKEINIVGGIVVAHDGAEALDYLFGDGAYAGSSTKDGLPQVVFLDLKLPKVDGLEVLGRIREDERTRILPVVILTSSDAEEDMVRAYRLGANSYVRKPVDFDSFLSVVKQLGMYWSIINKSPSERRSNWVSKPLRVLIVEDSVPDAELLLYELRQGGYDPAYSIVDAAEAMNDALDKQQWDIVLADYVMPNFGGLAALELLKAKGIDIPFIVVSGQIGEDIAVAAMKAGAHDYIMKRNLARLVPAVERELSDAEVRRERRKAEQERDGLMEQLRNVNERLVLSSMRNQEQSAELEAIINALAEAVVVFGPGGEIVRTNPIADELFGYSPAEREKPLMERLALLRVDTPDGAPFVLKDFPPVRALRGKTVRGVEAIIHRALDGKHVRVSISAAPISGPDGKVLGAVTIYTAITAGGGNKDVAGPKA